MVQQDCVTDLFSVCILDCVFFFKTPSPSRVWQPAITQTDEARLIEFKVNSFVFSFHRGKSPEQLNPLQ